MNIVKTTTAVAGLVVGAAGALLLGAGTASALTPVVNPELQYVGAVLDPSETRVAADIQAGNVINAVFGDRWTVGLDPKSVWNTGEWTPVTGDQFIDEAASHGGRVAVYLQTPDLHGNVFTAYSRW
ncbi:hypothetical protein [Rhodococcus sp. PvR099]|uniref:hypothetical protein n=1 Tax=Rhodococcus sp. PvR099 TaxID=2806602 RepID=UPI001AE6C34D|nr:hypothetical protein [Rhodococcus sp. PvR099]MBP1162008.1 hypothetical protein [Rhodococcus sp. PvR099]